MSKESNFSFNGQDVGYFESSSPMQDGPARYIPFRGPGHYDLQQALKAGLLPRCVYVINGVGISFDVLACPEYGVLELSNFQTDFLALPTDSARPVDG